MCVLPGDSWTCDIFATESSYITKKHENPELIDPTQTSYLGYTENTPEFTQPIDSFHTIDDTSNDQNNYHLMATPYPLIEITESTSQNNDVGIEKVIRNIRNISIPIAVKHSKDNYLYQFVNSQQQVLLSSANRNKEQFEDHLKWLNTLIYKLFAYQKMGTSLNQQIPSTTTTSATTEGPLVENTLRVNEYSMDNRDLAFLSYLVRNYFLKNSSNSIDSTTAQSKRNEETRSTSETNNDVDKEKFKEAIDKNSVDIVINGPKAANNIIVIKDNLGNKQYVTIEKYKTIASQLTTETVNVLPCTKSVRLPNDTDCNKYYNCDPKTASVTEFSCPPNTAFNDYTRVCDMQKYAICVTDVNNDSTLRISMTTSGPNVRNVVSQVEASGKTPCQTIGKYGDPTSDSHYYLCYSPMSRSADIKPVRMECPNNLVFCQEKKVCTTKQHCIK